MLTREQVEKIKTYGKWGDDIDALCDMALAWLEVQPRPISEAPEALGGGVLSFRRDVGWFMAVFAMSKAEGDGLGEFTGEPCWFTDSGDDLTNDMPTHFIPLSSLPTPDKVT